MFFTRLVARAHKMRFCSSPLVRFCNANGDRKSSENQRSALSMFWPTKAILHFTPVLAWY